MIDDKRLEIVDRAVEILNSQLAAFELNQAKPGDLTMAVGIARAIRIKNASVYGAVHTWEDTLPKLLEGTQTEALASDVALCLAASLILEGAEIPAPLRGWTYGAMMGLLPRP